MLSADDERHEHAEDHAAARAARQSCVVKTLVASTDWYQSRSVQKPVTRSRRRAASTPRTTRVVRAGCGCGAPAARRRRPTAAPAAAGRRVKRHEQHPTLRSHVHAFRGPRDAIAVGHDRVGTVEGPDQSRDEPTTVRRSRTTIDRAVRCRRPRRPGGSWPPPQRGHAARRARPRDREARRGPTAGTRTRGCSPSPAPAELVALEPALAEALGAAARRPRVADPDRAGARSTTSRPLDEVLATTMWPDEVAGAALVLERARAAAVGRGRRCRDDPAALDDAVARTPSAQDVRMAVVVTRDGGADVRAAPALARRRRRGARRRGRSCPASPTPSPPP